MPANGIHHVDLVVADVERSILLYLDLLGPLGWAQSDRYPTYRGTEEVVYLKDPATGSMLGIRPADGGAHGYYEVGIEHLAFEVDTRDEVEEAYARC
jgi:catechol 2,3-dioxygenase-like lactoylglutathione lyase family enzyme